MYAFDQGQFRAVLIPFQDEHGNSISEEQQARQILDLAVMDVAMYEADHIYISYSANYNQTAAIKKTYANGGWQTGTVGAHQADVMHHMESLMATEKEYQALQQIMRIAPITTIPASTDETKWLADLQADMDDIEDALKNKAMVYGWINQETSPEFAHAVNSPSGVIKTFPDAIHDFVQSHLRQFQTDYPVFPSPR